MLKYPVSLEKYFDNSEKHYDNLEEHMDSFKEHSVSLLLQADSEDKQLKKYNEFVRKK